MSYSNAGDFPIRGSRSVCGTLNNPTEDEINVLLNCSYAQYVCGSTEIAPSTGTVHWQFYMYFRNCIRLSTLKTLSPRAAFFACKGNAKQNIDYVLKQRPEDVEAGYDNTYNKQSFLEKGVKPNTEDRLRGVLNDVCALFEYVSRPDHDLSVTSMALFIDDVLFPVVDDLGPETLPKFPHDDYPESDDDVFDLSMDEPVSCDMYDRPNASSPIDILNKRFK